MDWQSRPTILLIALCEFLVGVDAFLPGYWYSLKGDGLGSVSCLPAVSSNVLEAILLEAGILKRHGKQHNLRFQQDVFYSGFEFLDGFRPTSIEHSQYRLEDTTKRKT